MTEGERARLIAWGRELRTVHERLWEALEVTRAAVQEGADAAPATRELLLFCRGFCVALTAHHEGEDRTLFPAIAAAHPDLRDTLRYLEQDHAMIGLSSTGFDGGIQATEESCQVPASMSL